MFAVRVLASGVVGAVFAVTLQVAVVSLLLIARVSLGSVSGNPVVSAVIGFGAGVIVALHRARRARHRRAQFGDVRRHSADRS